MKSSRIAKRIFGALVATTLLIASLSLNVFAADPVARVNGQTYNDVATAWKAVKNGGTIVMLKDWKINQRLEVNSGAKVTIEMNGHMIDRALANTDYSGKGDGQIFLVNDEATLTINGGTDTTHAGYVQNGLWFSGKKSGNTVNLTGGVLTGGACDDSDGAGAITMKEHTTVTLNNVNVVGNICDCFWTFYGDGGAIRMDSKNSTLNLNESRLMFNHSEKDGGAIYIAKDNCTVNMVRSVISNNYASDEGGGIYSGGEKTSIYMSEQSNISQNRADDGGGLYLNQDKAVVDMRNSEISYNTASDEGGGICSNDKYAMIRMAENSHIDCNNANIGGGVYFSCSNFNLRSTDQTSTISRNCAKNGDGGAVYINRRPFSFVDGASIYGITFDGNTASKDGGAIYIGQESVSISTCKFTNNEASDEGGAIYVNNDRNTLSGCTVTNNKAKTAGGGVFCSASVDIGLSGKMMITDNVRGDNSKDDLFLNDSASTSYLNGSPISSSNVGVRVKEIKERKLGQDAEFFFQDAFFLDQSEDYHVEFDEDKGELWIKKGKKTTIAFTEVDPIPTHAGDLNDEELIKGYFSYPSVTDGEVDLTASFFYSDGYFLNGKDGQFGDPNLYNPHLATMSMCMAMAGFYSNIGNDGSLASHGDRKYTYKSQNIERLLTDIGVAPEDIFISETNTLKPGKDTIGVAIGHKSIGKDGEILIPIAVRGAGYESEWYGNTTVGQSGEHEGFAIAADQVFELVKQYINDYDLVDAVMNSKVKFWIAGYSRAGATSNLTARRLVEEYSDGSSMNNQIYAYCFEAPKGGLNSEMNLEEEKYYCIHNCINKVDPVPLVAPGDMGFIRYGVDHYVPGTAECSVKTDKTVWSFVKNQPWAKDYQTWYDNLSWTVGTSSYNNQRAKMKSQLTSIDPENIYFYDRFSTATINYALGAYHIVDMIEPVETKLTQEQYITILMRALQAWGFYGTTNGDFRTGYAVNAQSTVTFQDALQSLTLLLFGKSAEEREGLMIALSGAMDRISNSGIEDFSAYSIWEDVIGDWCSLTQEKRDFYTECLRQTVLLDKGPDGKSVVDFLTAEEYRNLIDDWPVILDVLLRFVASDYLFDGDELAMSHSQEKTADGKYVTTNIIEGFDKDVVDTGDEQIILGSLAYNATALMQGHYPEINLAWLRSYDSFYDNEGDKPVRIANQAAPAVKYAISEDGETWTESGNQSKGDCYVNLTTETSGAGVYYRIKENNGSYHEWKPFNQSLQFTARRDTVETYTLEVTAVYCGTVSEPQEVVITVGQK